MLAISWEFREEALPCSFYQDYFRFLPVPFLPVPFLPVPFLPVPFLPVPFLPVPFLPVPFLPVPFLPVPFLPVPFLPVPLPVPLAKAIEKGFCIKKSSSPLYSAWLINSKTSILSN